jgi:DnaJ-domain-containing protein 1
MTMSNRFIPITLGAATAIPFGLLGGFGPTADHSILPWLGMLAGWGAWALVARMGIRRGWWLVAHEDRSPTSAYLRVLGLSPTDTRADVKNAFRKQSRKHHPDAGGDAEKFRELVEAKERVLED